MGDGDLQLREDVIGRREFGQSEDDENGGDDKPGDLNEEGEHVDGTGREPKHFKGHDGSKVGDDVRPDIGIGGDGEEEPVRG